MFTFTHDDIEYTLPDFDPDKVVPTILSWVEVGELRAELTRELGRRDADKELRARELQYRAGDLIAAAGRIIDDATNEAVEAGDLELSGKYAAAAKVLMDLTKDNELLSDLFAVLNPWIEAAGAKPEDVNPTGESSGSTESSTTTVEPQPTNGDTDSPASEDSTPSES